MIAPNKGGAMGGQLGMNKIERGGAGGEDNKYKGVMDWGTPRLVTK